MPLEGQQIGRYRLLRLLGSGGMGEVYLATDTLINRQVSIKVIRAEVSPYPDANARQEAARLFQREMKAIAMLDHPHILPLFDYGEGRVPGMGGEDSSYAYLVMPYRSEGSLTAWLQRRGSVELLSPQEVTEILTQAAGALQHAHNHQVIHQDVKPSNFLIQSNEENPSRPYLLLADFGVAKFNSATTSASQSVRGTPAYMAPEQWEGHPVPATDQYALATMAYELLTGRTPFQGGLSQMMYQHFNTPPRPPSTINPRIPKEIDAVLLCALAKRPEARFPSISTFASALEQAVHALPAEPAARPQQSPVDEIRATLAISSVEALTGTSRTLTLPGGRRVTVTVPAGAYDGQVITLPGLGEPANSGGQAGMLILTLAVQRAEQPPIAESAEQTIRTSNPNLENPLAPPPSPPPTGVAANPNRQRPIAPTFYPQEQVAFAPPPPPPSTNVAAPPPIRRRNVVSRSSLTTGRAILLVGLALLVIAGGVGLFFAIHANQVTTTNRNATATANTNATATIDTFNATATADAFNATATANTNATATADVFNATATANTNATATADAFNATATAQATATANPTNAICCTCSGNGCNGLDPVTTGCAGDAITVSTVSFSTGTVELRYSPTCGTNWGRVRSAVGPAMLVIRIQRLDGLNYYTSGANLNRANSPMVYGRQSKSQACGGVNGISECTPNV